MTVDRRDVLKLGALGLAGAACSARRSSSGPLATTSARVTPAPFVEAAGSRGRRRGRSSSARLFAGVRLLQQALAAAAPLGLGARAKARRVGVARRHRVRRHRDIERTRSLYKQQRARPEYAALVAETRVLGIWDDHDYGKNDAGSEYPKRVESQAALLDFLDEPTDSPRRQRRGTYESYEFGSGNERVKVILLDARYHRDRPGRDADTLGDEQWAWFEKELGSSTAALTIVASSYQVLPEEHPQRKVGEIPARSRATVRAPAVLGDAGRRVRERRSPLRGAVARRRTPVSAIRSTSSPRAVSPTRIPTSTTRRTAIGWEDSIRSSTSAWCASIGSDGK